MFSNFTFGDVILLIAIIAGIVVAALYFLNKWAYKKMGEQQDVIDRTRQTVSIFVIDKRKDKAENANFPKSVQEQLPKRMKFMKLPLVKAKVGPQIITFLCDKKVFNALPLKKNVKVDVAGIYILDMKGMKSEKEMKAAAKAKKEKEKEEKKAKK